MSVTIDMSGFNKKVRKLERMAKTSIEVGIIDKPEEARKGMLLNYGTGGQVARPWFTGQMTPSNTELIKLIEEALKEVYEDKMSMNQFGQLLRDFAKQGIHDVPMEKLLETTLEYKAGLVARPDTGRRRSSKGPAEQIGIDSGKMIKAVKYKLHKH